jgi:hypothetical protein
MADLVQASERFLSAEADGGGQRTPRLFFQGCAMRCSTPTQSVEDGIIEVSDEDLAHDLQITTISISTQSRDEMTRDGDMILGERRFDQSPHFRSLTVHAPSTRPSS